MAMVVTTVLMARRFNLMFVVAIEAMHMLVIMPMFVFMTVIAIGAMHMLVFMTVVTIGAMHMLSI